MVIFLLHPANLGCNSTSCCNVEPPLFPV